MSMPPAGTVMKQTSIFPALLYLRKIHQNLSFKYFFANRPTGIWGLAEGLISVSSLDTVPWGSVQQKR